MLPRDTPCVCTDCIVCLFVCVCVSARISNAVFCSFFSAKDVSEYCKIACMPTFHFYINGEKVSV